MRLCAYRLAIRTWAEYAGSRRTSRRCSLANRCMSSSCCLAPSRSSRVQPAHQRQARLSPPSTRQATAGSTRRTSAPTPQTARGTPASSPRGSSSSARWTGFPRGCGSARGAQARTRAFTRVSAACTWSRCPRRSSPWDSAPHRTDPLGRACSTRRDSRSRCRCP